MQARQLVPQEHSLLKQFAAMAARQLELAAAAKSQAQQAYIESHAAALCNATQGYQEPTMLCDISNQQHWRIRAVNDAWVQATGICRSVLALLLHCHINRHMLETCTDSAVLTHQI